jgi:phospholipase D1/2
MEALSKAILSAREEIFISNWWLSPELMLVRPFQDDSMRLDNLLGKRAVSYFLKFDKNDFISIK